MVGFGKFSKNFQIFININAARRLRGCLITYVNPQVDVFLLKLHIVKREHGGCYVTDEQWAS